MKELSAKDVTGISFWIISIALIASTAFLLIERGSVNQKWQLPMTISALVTGIASLHYLYMRSVWVQKKKSPVAYRYIDWFLTVPLQIMEFYLVLSVDQDVPQSLLATLLGASVIMILFGFLGETGRIPKTVGFGVGMVAWGYIVYEIFFGTGAKFEQESKDKSVKMAFNAMRWIVTVDWAIYPIGYLVGNTKTMNIIYNLGDFVNKIAFTGAIWYAASIDDTDK
ncbi:MAG: bacteriorhodopsin [Cyanophyceae cyanobacterium]